MKNNLSFLLFVFFVFIVEDGFSQAGALDSTFGTNGIGAFPFTDGVAYSVMIQPDGKIIASGHIPDSFAVARFKNNGTLDSAFGTNGKAKAMVGWAIDGGGYLALQPDGKILLAGGCIENNGKYSCALVRMNNDGTLDNTFSGDGKVITIFNNSGYDDNAFCVAVQSDGKIIEGGSAITDAGIQGFAAVRYNNDGTIDNSFGTNGKLVFPIGNELPFAVSIIIQPDGKILLGGYSWSTNLFPINYAIARLNSNGSLDNSFGIGGKVTTYFGLGGETGDSLDYDEGHAVALQSDGKILLTGGSYLGFNGYSTMATVRYNSDGSIDNSFGLNGKIETQIPGYINPSANSIVIQADNKIVIAGACAQSPRQFVALVRYFPNGSIDSTFDGDGIIITAVDTTADMANSIALQQDNKIVIAGYSTLNGMIVARYLPGIVNGIIDFSMVADNLITYPNPITSQVTFEYSLILQEFISLSLYDMQGREVQSFFTNQVRDKGIHTEFLLFNKELPSGTYIINISNGKNSMSTKIIKE